MTLYHQRKIFILSNFGNLRTHLSPGCNHFKNQSHALIKKTLKKAYCHYNHYGHTSTDLVTHINVIIHLEIDNWAQRGSTCM